MHYVVYDIGVLALTILGGAPGLQLLGGLGWHCLVIVVVSVVCLHVDVVALVRGV